MIDHTSAWPVGLAVAAVNAIRRRPGWLVAGTSALRTAHRADRGGVSGEDRPGNGKLARPVLGGDRGWPPNSLDGGGIQRWLAACDVPGGVGRLRVDGEPAVRSEALPNRSLERTGLAVAAKIDDLHPAAQLRS